MTATQAVATREAGDDGNAVLEAIAAITGKIGSVEKRGKNQFHNYNYATAADILHKLQPMLAEHGLIIMPTQKEARFLDDGQALFAIDYEFSLYHKNGAVHPEKPILTGMAAARNSKGGFDDKIANKCLTAATKYFLLTLFKIPTGDYDDADADDDRPVSAETATPRKSSYRARKDGDFEFTKELAAITSEAALIEWREKNADRFAKFPKPWLESFNAEMYEPKLAELRSAKVRTDILAGLHKCTDAAAIAEWQGMSRDVFRTMTKADQADVVRERDARLAELFNQASEDGETADPTTGELLMAG